MKISEMNPSIRPYERLVEFGVEALSDEELLAILLRNGTKGKSSKEIASQILSSLSPDEGLNGLRMLTVRELASFDGVGRVKAIQMLACMELGRRSFRSYPIDRHRFLNDQNAISFFEERMSFLPSEEIQVVTLDVQKKLISCDVIGRGGIGGVGFCERELFRTAVKVNAAGLILAHNHPSGDPTPSHEDIEATWHLMKCGEMIGIEVVDHIIVGRGLSVSMKKDGFMEVNV